MGYQPSRLPPPPPADHVPGGSVGVGAFTYKEPVGEVVRCYECAVEFICSEGDCFPGGQPRCPTHLATLRRGTPLPPPTGSGIRPPASGPTPTPVPSGGREKES